MCRKKTKIIKRRFITIHNDSDYEMKKKFGESPGYGKDSEIVNVNQIRNAYIDRPDDKDIIIYFEVDNHRIMRKVEHFETTVECYKRFREIEEILG